MDEHEPTAKTLRIKDGDGVAADLIALSTNVITMEENPAARAARGVAVTGGRILGLVGEDGIEHLRGPETVIHDFGDRPVLPGFVDVHAHTEVACRSMHGTVDCRAPECHTISDVLEALTEAAGRERESDWLVGQANLFFDRKL